MHLRQVTYANYANDVVSVGDLTDENAIEDDKPLNSIALAKFLGKAAKVTALLTWHVSYFLPNFE